MNTTPLLTGGCQCGAVRYALNAAPTGATICHCRMCQKATGGYFAPFAGVKRASLKWTRGGPAIFKSSAKAERGFCEKCGTPLTFSYIDRDRISVSLGSLDDPSAVRPELQYGIEGRLPFFAELAALPGERTEDELSPERLAEMKSFQHPDGEKK